MVRGCQVVAVTSVADFRLAVQTLYESKMQGLFRSQIFSLAPGAGDTMKRLNLLCTLLVVLGLSADGRGEDSLFSRTPINSVFVQPGVAPSAGPAGPQQPASPPSARLSGGPALAEIVGQTGLDAKIVGENVVSTKVQHESWSFPALVTTSEDRDQVVLILLLSVVQDEQQLPAGKLLELMNANRDQAPAFFAFSSKRKRIELYRTLENNGLTADQIRREIGRLAEIAVQTQPLWKFDKESAKPAPRPQQASPPQAAAAPTAKPAATASAFVGRWAASRSKTEAFAMQLKSDGTFVLVHVNQGKQTRSTGKFTVSGQQLTLASDDGSKLAGSVQNMNGQEFQFQPLGGKSGSLTFKKAG